MINNKSMNYPNGKKFNENIVSNNKKIINSGNRGMKFENDINITNDYYLRNGICLIYKRPTPVNIVHVDYTRNIITEAYFEKESTTDYNGVYKGKYIDFEAKSTKLKTSFPLSNIFKHQIEHLKKVIKHGGIAFFLINFSTLDKTYLLQASYIINFYETRDRESIPLEEIAKNGYEINKGYIPRYDYIKIIDKLYFK